MTPPSGSDCCDTGSTSDTRIPTGFARLWDTCDFRCADHVVSGMCALMAFITEPGPIRKILTHLGEPLEPPPLSPARGPPIDWGELVQVHDDRAIFQGRIDELPVIDIHCL
ncbi:MAG: hypothetical protein ACKOEX_10495 [Planctomycetia bacterium]